MEKERSVLDEMASVTSRLFDDEIEEEAEEEEEEENEEEDQDVEDSEES